MKLCICCKKRNAVLKHHTNYDEGTVVPFCKQCHQKLHKTRIDRLPDFMFKYLPIRNGMKSSGYRNSSFEYKHKAYGNWVFADGCGE